MFLQCLEVLQSVYCETLMGTVFSFFSSAAYINISRQKIFAVNIRNAEEKPKKIRQKNEQMKSIIRG